VVIRPARPRAFMAGSDAIGHLGVGDRPETHRACVTDLGQHCCCSTKLRGVSSGLRHGGLRGKTPSLRQFPLRLAQGSGARVLPCGCGRVNIGSNGPTRASRACSADGRGCGREQDAPACAAPGPTARRLGPARPVSSYMPAAALPTVIKLRCQAGALPDSPSSPPAMVAWDVRGISDPETRKGPRRREPQ